MCNLRPTSSFLLSFPPKLGRQNYVGLEGLFSTPFSFSLIFSPEPNKRKFHFPSYFPFFRFHPPCFHPNWGLRDIAMFNDSLLAKQAWRLLHNSDSLFYKVFKAHFFPTYSIMEAKNSHVGSHTWTGILHERDVLLRGC